MALQLWRQARQRYYFIGDRDGEARSLTSIAMANQAMANQLWQQGNEQYTAGQFREAMQSWSAARQRYRYIGDRAGEARSLTGIGLAHVALGQYQFATNSGQEALSLAREVGDRPLEFNALRLLGDANYQYYLANRDSDQSSDRSVVAISNYQDALKIAQALGDRVKERQVLDILGRITLSKNRYEQAAGYYQQALAIDQQTGDRQAESQTLRGLGSAYLGLGNYQEAIDQYQQALSIHRELDDPQGKTSILQGLGNAYAGQNQYEKAIDSYRQALELVRQSDNRTLEVEVLNDLGRTYSSAEQYQQAVESYQDVVTIARESRNRGWERRALLDLGDSHIKLSNYQLATDSYQRVLEMTYWRQEGDQAARVLGRLGLANVYASQGQYQQATEQLNHVNNFWALGENNSPLRAEISQRFGDVYFSLGQYQQAIEAYRRGLDVARQNGNLAIAAASLEGLGNTYNSLGQAAEAERYRQEARTVYGQLGTFAANPETALTRARAAGNRAEESRLLISLGDTSVNQEQYQEAIAAYIEGLSIARDIGIRREESLALVGLGDTYQGLADYPQALEFYQEGLAAAREIGLREVEARTLNSLGWLHLNQGAVAEAETYLAGAVAVFDSLRDTALADAYKVSLFERQVSAYKGLEQTYILQEKPEAALEAAERGRARAFIDMLAQNVSSQQTEAFSAAPPNLAAIQAIARTERSVLVQYSFIETGPDSPKLYIWVVQPSGQLDFRTVELTTATADLANLVTNSREAMGVRGRGGFEIALSSEPTTTNQQLRQLHQLLIAPIADLLPTNPRDRVVFIPQGPLFLVPFAALQNEAGEYLIEHHTILTAPSIQALALSRQQRAPRRIGSTYTPQKLLLVGNPTMPPVWNPDTGQRSPLSPLPGSEREVVEIATTYRAEALVGANATEAIVKQRIGDAMVVHLATHGLLEYGDPQSSSGQDVPGAIALAPGNGEDGLLTAAEILEDIQLSAEIVVLSACDTGRGDITGDGVIGLSRSLMAAGTPTVIVSLWAVPDAPTAQLMMSFYRKLLQEETRDQALRQAMLQTMQTHPNPADWAAFTFIGLGE
ncbi:CHAT domain-containing protein [Nodosilinea sp. PGN35]|uniref:CHAT domain-containing protein n=1 Tax=Nodosilinea sp. PGN35 TaxID=3020489 RepID=UPI0023B33966|nr:CHAT domain-containing protein [Nodosilinea sp. TSF1-S3]MDF0366242.1 CHAT domain-containing protein [Nodosilinea sp. TSF1-S3]